VGAVLLRDEIWLDQIARRVTNPLSGLKAVAYCGCVVLRSPEEVAHDELGDESITAVQELFPDVLVPFEDFADTNAFRRAGQVL
jgi:heterodisulfide reductase subunit B